MNVRFFLILMAFAMTMLLSACQENKSYDYLVQHPSVLRKNIEACEFVPTQSSCAEIERIKTDVRALVQERANDPEEFGQKIMKQQQLVQALQQAGKDDQAAQRQLNLLYAVIVITSQHELS